MINFFRILSKFKDRENSRFSTRKFIYWNNIYFTAMILVCTVSVAEANHILRRTYFILELDAVVEVANRESNLEIIKKGDLKKWFHTDGVKFAEGSKIVYDESNGVLDIWNTSKNHSRIKKILQQKERLLSLSCLELTFLRIDGLDIGSLQARNNNFGEYLKKIPEDRVDIIQQSLFPFIGHEPMIGTHYPYEECKWHDPDMARNFEGLKREITMSDISQRYLPDEGIRGLICWYHYYAAKNESYVDLICKMNFTDFRFQDEIPMELDLQTRFYWKPGELDDAKILFCRPAMVENQKIKLYGSTLEEMPAWYYFTARKFRIWYKSWGEEYEALSDNMKNLQDYLIKSYGPN